MHLLLTCVIVVLLSAGTVAASEPELATPPQTVKGNLLTIEGNVYMIRDVLGRFIRLRVTKSTKGNRALAPGENIEAQISPEGQALSIRSTP